MVRVDRATTDTGSQRPVRLEGTVRCFESRDLERLERGPDLTDTTGGDGPPTPATSPRPPRTARGIGWWSKGDIGAS